MTTNEPKPMTKCEHCGKFFQAHDARAKFCSTACKQAAYRKRKDPNIGDYERMMLARQKSAETRKTTYRQCECEQCGIKFQVSVSVAANLRYCSAACKQKAYRQRAKLGKFANLPMVEYVRAMHRAFIETWGREWIYGYKDVSRDAFTNGYNIVTTTNITHWLGDEKQAKTYLLDYVQQGKPNPDLRRLRE